MRLMITAATAGEWMPCSQAINALFTEKNTRWNVSFHQCGVGLMSNAFFLTKIINEEKPDLILQVGIAGSFDFNIILGKVVVINSEAIGDMGVEEEGQWKDIFDLNLEQSDCPPYQNERLPNPWIEKYNLLKLPAVNGLTVNEISTKAQRIQQLKKKYSPVTESMEGAALHYVCRQMNIPFLQVRAISNYVGERNKENWKIKIAIENLNYALLKYIEEIYRTS